MVLWRPDGITGCFCCLQHTVQTRRFSTARVTPGKSEEPLICKIVFCPSIQGLSCALFSYSFTYLFIYWLVYFGIYLYWLIDLFFHFLWIDLSIIYLCIDLFIYGLIDALLNNAFIFALVCLIYFCIIYLFVQFFMHVLKWINCLVDECPFWAELESRQRRSSSMNTLTSCCNLSAAIYSWSRVVGWRNTCM